MAIEMEEKKITPTQAARRHCKECCVPKKDIPQCGGDTLLDGTICHLFPYRLKGKVPVRAIRRYCLHCMSGSSELVEWCHSKYCDLVPFRFGTNPYYVMTEKRKENLRKAQEKRAGNVK